MPVVDPGNYSTYLGSTVIPGFSTPPVRLYIKAHLQSMAIHQARPGVSPFSIDFRASLRVPLEKHSVEANPVRIYFDR